MISGFKNKYSFLSNFYSVKVEYKGVIYDNAESAYQAQKCKNALDKSKFVGISGAEAKKLGRKIEVINGWDDVKRQIMFEIVYQKFLQNKSLADRLAETGNNMLVETNYWHDNYWGSCECENCECVNGDNNLGFILMHVRYLLSLNKKSSIKEVVQKFCPLATPFYYPKCISFNPETMTCNGISTCKEISTCKDYPYK